MCVCVCVCVYRVGSSQAGEGVGRSYPASEAGEADSMYGTHTPAHDGAPHSPTASIASTSAQHFDTATPPHTHSPPHSEMGRGAMRGPPAGAGPADAADVALGAARRLGVKLEHRTDIRRLVAMLQARLDKVCVYACVRVSCIAGYHAHGLCVVPV